jgi:hypothetical protein
MRNRCKCKSLEFVLDSYNFEVGTWYIYSEDDYNSDIIYVYFTNDGSIRDKYYWSLYRSEFESNFLTEQEVREMEINKVLEL